MGRLGSTSPLPLRCRQTSSPGMGSWASQVPQSFGSKELHTSSVISVILFCLFDQTLPIVGLKKQWPSSRAEMLQHRKAGNCRSPNGLLHVLFSWLLSTLLLKPMPYPVPQGKGEGSRVVLQGEGWEGASAILTSVLSLCSELVGLRVSWKSIWFLVRGGWISESNMSKCNNSHLYKCPSQPYGGFVVHAVTRGLFGTLISAAFRCMINTLPNVYISI